MHFFFGASHFDDQRLFININNPGAEDFDQLQDFGAVARVAGYLNQRQIADDGLLFGDIIHPNHVDQLIQVGLDAAGGQVVGLHYNRHSAHPRLFGVTDGKRFDIERPATEQRGYAVEDSGFVFDMGYENMFWHSVKPDKMSG